MPVLTGPLMVFTSFPAFKNASLVTFQNGHPVIITHWPEPQGSPFRSLAKIVNLAEYPALARINPGPSAHVSNGNAELVVTLPSLLITLDRAALLEVKSTMSLSSGSVCDSWSLSWVSLPTICGFTSMTSASFPYLEQKYDRSIRGYYN